MIAPFPHRYDVELKWAGGLPATARAAGRPEIEVGPPPQFGGQEAWWSPEHLLLSSLSACLMTTFLALAERAKLSVGGYTCRAQGVLEKTKDGIVFTGFSLFVSLKAAETEARRLEELVHTAKKYCIVSNSLRAPVAVTVQTEAAVSPA